VGSNFRWSARFRLRNVLTHPAEPLDESLGPEDWVELRKAWTLLDELLERLPDELRRVLVLADIEEVAVAEIAALEGIPAGTAASRLRRAREEFQQLLARTEHRNPFSKVAR
jgi:RNA polymerase sigma-70 factor (ECF subfamily)